MSFIRRFTRTPPPRKQSSDPIVDQAIQTERATPPPKAEINFRDRVMAMLSADPADRDRSEQAASELKQFASKAGYYVVASEVRTATEYLANRKDQTGAYRIEAGYAFAADMILRHLLQEIENLRQKPDTLGPNVFGSYCTDMLENMIRAQDLSHAVESVVLIAERLLSQSVEFPPLRYAYLDLAGSGLTNSRDLLSHHCKQSENLRRRTPRERNREETPEQAADRRRRVQEEQAVQYLDRLASGYGEVRKAMSGDANEHRHESEADRLLSLLTPLDSAGFLGFAAWLTQRAGATLVPADSDRGRKLLLNSARMYESQGDIECKIGLLRLAASRYGAAIQLYTRLGEVNAADNVRMKLTPRSAR